MTGFSELHTVNRTMEPGKPLVELTEPLEFSFSLNGDRGVTVPAGFVTNYASVPRFLWSIFPPFGPWDPATVFHDYLYSAEATCSRFLADAMFREAMAVLGVPWWRRVVMYYAVRLFGGFVYTPSVGSRRKRFPWLRVLLLLLRRLWKYVARRK